MPIFMMTSVDTLYEVSAQDTNPINQLGAPNIDAMFHGLTQMQLQSSKGSVQNNPSIEASFQQQQKYLDDAAHVAINIFNPTQTNNQRYRATLKLTATTGNIQPFAVDSESSGLAYTLALALTWGNKKGLFNSSAIPDIPVFATGCVPLDCYIKPIGHLQNKIQFACDAIEKKLIAKNDTDQSHPAFYIFIPAGNLVEYTNTTILVDKVSSLGGKVIAINHASEAVTQLMKEAFDGGIFTHIDNGFIGLNSIPYEKRHLFMGREELVQELLIKSQMAIEQRYILNVTGVSGSGKSSAVMAGLLPQLLTLKNKQSLPIFKSDWKLIRPNQINHIDDLLSELFKHISSDRDTISEWLSLKSTPNNLASAIKEYLEKLAVTEEYSADYVVWVIDQYEELFTHNQITLSEAQTVFPLLAAIADIAPVHIITVLRTEYLSALGGQASIDVQLPRRIQAKEIEHIIELQLQYHRLQTESALDLDREMHRRQHLEVRMKNDAIGKPLTTVSYLLQQMHEQMVQENPSATTLTHQHYEAVGEINGVMARQAELALEEGLSQYDTKHHPQIINMFFESLIGIDDEHPTARTLANSHIDFYPPELKSIIQAFMSKGLIIDCGKGASPKIKLAHDTLLNQQADQPHWTRLIEWFSTHQAYLSWRQDIEPYFAQWLTSAGKYYLLSSHAIKQSKKLNVLEFTHNASLRNYLIQSQKKHTQQKIRPWIITLVGSLLMGLGVWDYYFRIKIEYSGLLGERYGIPFAIDQLSEVQRQSRHHYYQLQYKGGDLISLSHRNSYGNLMNDPNRENAARWKFQYTANGNLLENNSFANNGKRLKSKLYEFTPAKNAARIRFKFHGTNTSIGNVSYQSSTLFQHNNNKSQITQHKVEFDQSGYITKRYFYNNNDFPAKNASGIYGLQFKYNDNGLLIESEYLDENGEKKSIKGVYKKQLKRNKHGYITDLFWLDNNGELTLNLSGYSHRTRKLDNNSNIIEQAFFNNNGHPTLHSNGYARVTISYDEWGNQIEQSVFDTEGKLTPHKHGFARAVAVFDDQGNQTQWNYLGVDGQPTLRSNGFAKIKVKYDDRGNRVEESYYNTDGNPTLHTNGYSRFNTTYDKFGNRTEQAYFGIDGKPTLHKNGYAKYTAQYDENDNRTEETYFDVNDEPVLHKNGYARATVRYDNRGNKIERSFFGIDNTLTLNHYGYASFQATFDEQGNRNQVSFFGADKQPITNKYGFAQVKYTYDSKGNIVRWGYYDTSSALTLHKDGVAVVKAKYDSRGNKTEVSFYDTDDQPTLRLKQFSIMKLSYNPQNHLTEWSFWGMDNKPALQKGGYIKAKAFYDTQGNRTDIVYYNENNQPINKQKQQ